MASAACVNNNNSSSSRSLPWIAAASDMDFEFCCLNEGVDGNGMLPADQLFSNGKLLPLLHRVEEPPKAPTTSGAARWKHLLPFKKKRPSHSSSSSSSTSSSTSSSSLPSLALPSNNSKSLKHFLPSKCCPTSSDSSLKVPLLQKESLSVSSSFSSSSRHELNNVEHVLPRLSLDSSSMSMRSRPNMNMNMKGTPVGVGLVESPRMNSWGKIVFHTSLSSLSLERSSSSPSSFFNNHVNNNNNPYTLRRSYSSTTSTTSSSRPSSLPSLFPFRPLFSSRTTPATTAPTITLPHHHHQHPHPHRHTHKLNP